jgi:histone H3/H4
MSQDNKDPLRDLDMISDTDELGIKTSKIFEDEDDNKYRKKMINNAREKKHHKNDKEISTSKTKQNGKVKKELKYNEVDEDEYDMVLDDNICEDELEKVRPRKQRKEEKGIRKTPFRKNLKYIIQNIKESDDFFKNDPKLKGKNFSVESDSYAMFKKATEEHISAIFSIAQLISRINKKHTISPVDFHLATLLHKKSNPNLWDEEDMIKIRLAGAGEDYNNIDNMEYYSLDQLLQNKNWRKLHTINEVLLDVDDENERCNMVDEYISENEFDGLKPRRAAILSGLSNHSVKLGVEIPYDEKRILKNAKRNQNSRNRVEMLFRRKNNLKPLNKTRKTKLNQARNKKIEQEMLSIIENDDFD